MEKYAGLFAENTFLIYIQEFLLLCEKKKKTLLHFDKWKCVKVC